MITFLIGILDYMFLGWIFWPMFLVFSFWSYSSVRKSKHEFAFFPLVLIAIMGFAAVWRWPVLKLMFNSWELIGMAIGGYIVAGFFVSLYKYIAELHDFKKEAPDAIKRGKIMPFDLQNELDLPSNSVRHEGAEYYLDWKAFPHALWWTYWPLFIFSIILDPITRFIDWAVGFLKTFYHSLAKKFSVSSNTK